MKRRFRARVLSRRGMVGSTLLGLAGLGTAKASPLGAPAPASAESEDTGHLVHMDQVERFVAVDNKCAWPNLTLMPDDSIVATIFGSPCHGFCDGAAECWRSDDGGRMWKFVSIPAPNEPGTNRKDLAAGLTPKGSFVVLCSGSKVAPPDPVTKLRPIIQSVVCRSTDGLKTWTCRSSLELPPGADHVIPFGDIAALPDGRLAVTGYTGDHIRTNTAWVFFSDDDGRTWGNPRPLGEDDFNESTLLVTGGKRLLAATRTHRNSHTHISVSEDAGQTWRHLGPASLPGQVPANLIRLQDGGILLTYGSRLRGMLGVFARISRDEGLTWGAPRVLFNTTVRRANTRPGGVDGGYPSSVQLKDGTIVTAYYCQRIPMHQRYHMGVVRWRVS